MSDNCDDNDARLIRFKQETPLQRDQIPEGPRYTFVHSRLNEETSAELEEIVAHMAGDTELRRLNESPGRPDAVRFAIGIAVAHVRGLKRSEEGAGE